MAVRASPWMRVALAVFGVEMRRFARSPVVVVGTLVMPAAVACVLSIALGGIASYDTEWAVVDHDGGPVAEAFVSEVAEHPSLRGIVEVDVVDEAEAMARLDAYEVSAVIVLNDGLTERVAAGVRPGVEVRAPAEPGTGTDIARAAVTAFEVEAWGLGQMVDRPPGREAASIRVSVSDLGGRSIDAATRFGPAVGLFFLLMSMGFGAQRAVDDRQSGVEGRHRVAASPPSAVMAGRTVANIYIGLLSMLIVAVVMTLGFDRGWGPASAVVPLVVATAVACSGIAVLVGSFVRSADAVQGTVAAVGFVTLVLSGGFNPPGSGSSSALGRWTPTGRALEALTYTAVSDLRFGAVVGDVGYLVAWGAGAMGIVVVSERWRR